MNEEFTQKNQALTTEVEALGKLKDELAEQKEALEHKVHELSKKVELQDIVLAGYKRREQADFPKE